MMFDDGESWRITENGLMVDWVSMAVNDVNDGYCWLMDS